MKLRALTLLFLLADFLSHSANATAQVEGTKEPKERVISSATVIEPEVVAFPGPNRMTLHGFLYLPSGERPFPAMIWNHGSEAKPGRQPELAEFYTSKGFVFFVPHRHGHGRSAEAGPYHMDLQRQCKSQDCLIQLHELYNKDVAAAVEWIKKQAFVDKDRIVMSGVSFGGIQTLLSAEKGLGVRAFVSFAPAAMSWNNNPDLRVRLLRAVKKARRPTFLIQADGDFNIGPYEMLGTYLVKKGGLNKGKLYPRFGSSNQEAHGAFATKADGIRIWQTDVLAFLNAAMK